MFFCDQCKHEASSEATLKYHQDTEHQDTKYVHEGVKHPCGQCGHQLT